MAQYTSAFNVAKAVDGAQNIWTRSGLPVVFGGYNDNATDPLKEVQVWVNGAPADYPADGRKNGVIDDPLDLLMVTEDVIKYTPIFNIGNPQVLYTLTYPLYATLVEAEANSTKAGYSQSVSVAVVNPKNI